LKLKFQTVVEKTAQKNFRGLLYFAAPGILPGAASFPRPSILCTDDHKYYIFIFQCFYAVGWVIGKIDATCEKSVAPNFRNHLHEDQEETTKQGFPGEWPLNKVCFCVQASQK